MTDQIKDNTVAGTAKDNVPTMSKPMDEIHSNVEDISNKASGYKVINQLKNESGTPPLLCGFLLFSLSSPGYSIAMD